MDEFIKDRTSQGLAHVFTLLSLVQPAEPLQIAYRGLLTGDENLRGTALEYLEGTLPPAIRARSVAVPRGSPARRTAPPGRATKFCATCYAHIHRFS